MDSQATGQPVRWPRHDSGHIELLCCIRRAHWTMAYWFTIKFPHLAIILICDVPLAQMQKKQQFPLATKMYTAQVLMVLVQIFLFCFFLCLSSNNAPLNRPQSTLYLFLQLYTSAKLPEWIAEWQEKEVYTHNTRSNHLLEVSLTC
jgi:hypothetical protein